MNAEGQLGPIGVFDSGYGGLTVLRSIVDEMPAYSYLYLGDNARSPYGTRSFQTVYEYTLEAVQWLFKKGCPLVILACNTASAKALRSIQQQDLPKLAPQNRVLGVIRPTTEILGHYSKNKAVGILATKGTVQSESYPIELKKFFPEVKVYQHACPMWVPLIENGEHLNEGADFFIKKDLNALLHQSAEIDTILLACTHYPLLADRIKMFLPPQVQLITQGSIVADRLKDYLSRHPEMEQRLEKNGDRMFFTSDEPLEFNRQASRFFKQPVESEQITLQH